MARRFWWFAAAFLLTLVIVTTDCQRRSSNHATVEGQEATIRSRSDLKFSSKAKKGIETTPSPFSTSSRPTRRSAGLSTPKTNSRTTPKARRGHEKNIGSSRVTEKAEISGLVLNKKLENLKKGREFRRQQPDDLARAATEDRRYLPEVGPDFQSVKKDSDLVKEDFQSVKVSEQKNLETPAEPARSNRGNKNVLSRPRNFDSRSFDSSSNNPGLVAPKIPASNPSGRKSSRAERTGEDSTEASDRGGDVSRASRRHFTERSTRRQESSLPSLASESTSVSSLSEGRAFSPRKSSGRSRDSKLKDRSADSGSSGDNRKTLPRESKNPSIRGRELRLEGGRKNGEQSREMEESKKKSETMKKLDKIKKQERFVKLNSGLSTSTLTPEVTTGGVLSSTTTRARKIEQQEGKTGARKNSGQTQGPTRRFSSTGEATKSPIVSTTESSTTTASSTEVNFSVTPTRARGSKLNKASVTPKIDREPLEDDNYPEEFKAKLAQLKNTNTKGASTKTSLQPGEGLKQRLSEASSSPRSRSKPQPARTPTEPPEKLKSKDSSTIARPIGRSLDLTTEIPNSKSFSAFDSDEPKTIKGPTRFGTSRPSSTTSRASVTVTFPTIDKKTTVTSRSITRRSDRVASDQPSSTTEAASPSKENRFPSTTQRSLPTVKNIRPWNTPYIDRNWQEPATKAILIERKSTTTPTPTKRPKGWRDSIDKSAHQETTTTEVPPTNKYPRWKPGGLVHEEPSTTSRVPLEVAPLIRRHEFRPRTATYRRHSELPAPVENSIQSKDNLSIAITPKVPKFNSSIGPENLTHRSIRQEPSIEVSNLLVNNGSTSENGTGISLSNRGSSGNSDSNIFNPTKSTYLISSNASLLEQLRSTVAPLLSALGNKTPIFSGSYSNVHTSNSQPRVTPSGTPPKFSARYRGAELFVRKPNGLEPSGPPSGPSSTTPQTLTKDEDTIRSPEIAISSPGEPNVITFYQALETASITNEIDQTTENIKHQNPNIIQVESNKDSSMKIFTSNAVNDTSTIVEKNLVQANTLAPSLRNVEDSQDPGNESTTKNSTTTQSDTTESTANHQNVLTNDFSTVSILNYSEETATIPSNVEVSSSTQVPTEISNEIDEIPELMLTTMEIPTTTQREFGVTGKAPSVNFVPDFVEPLHNLLEDVNKNDATTTFSPEILTTQVPEVSSTSSTIEVDNSESTMTELESLAQFTVVPPTTQVIEEEGEEKLTTVPFDPDSVTMISTDAFENLNTSENAELSSDLPSSIDNEVLTMINRLMKILVNDNTTFLNSIQEQQAGVEFDDSGRIVGGFLDNNDNSSITVDVENSNGTNSQFLNLESEKLLSTESTISTLEQIGAINSTTMASEIQTMLQSDTVKFEQTTPNTNEVNKMLLTTSMPEIVEKKNISETQGDEPGLKIVLELTTNMPTITSTLLSLDDTLMLTTNEPNIFGNLQDGTPANIQMTTTDIEAQASTTISPSPAKNSSLTELFCTTQSTTSTSSELPKSSTSSELPKPQISTIPAVKTSSPGSASYPNQFAGRFGGSRITPAPKFSASSSTRQPLRDYHVYGIYPNKTIVRKRPDDNLIDARNVDSPYVIFGIYPDGKLVRKFPNGTVIPDPPVIPVEIVFSLSTSTTTNRPQLNEQFNPSNQIINNWNVTLSNKNKTNGDDVYKNPSGPTDDNGLSSNALRPNGNGPNQPNGTRTLLLSTIGNVGNQPFSTNMTEVVSDAEMRVSINTTESLSDLLTTSGPAATTTTIGTTTTTVTTPSSVNSQGGRIIQDRERDKASRTKEAGGQRSTVYIGQEKFIDYWTDDPPGNNSRVVSVKINSVTNALNGLPGSSNLGSSAASSSSWKDPLDQIFGTSINASTAEPSKSSNIIDEAVASRFPITETPINPFSEVFTPMLNDAQLAKDTWITTTSSEPSVSTKATTTTTSTPPPSSTTTTTTTTTAPTTTTTTKPSSTTKKITTTFEPSTFSSTTTSSIKESSTQSLTTPTIPQQTPFGTKFDDLAFLNSLLQPSGHLKSISSTPKTLTEVEQLLANKILSLALGNPGPMRSAKAIQPSNSAGNLLEAANIESPLRPIIIDLLQTTTKNSASVGLTTSKPATWKPVSIVTPAQRIQRITEAASSISKSTTAGNSFPTIAPRSSTIPVSWTTTQKSWTGFPTLPSASTTTQKAWTGFPTLSSVSTTTQKTWTGFPTYSSTTKLSSTTTTPRTTTTINTPKIVTTRKPAPKPKPTQAPFRFGAGLLQALFGRNIFAQQTVKPAATRRPVQTTPKPVQTTAKPDFSEEDAKFLTGLLSEPNKKGENEEKKKPSDDESFLRSILNGQAKVKAPAPSSASNFGSNNAALLAQLLKSQGIEPSTPANRLREQLQLAGQANDGTSTVRPKPTATRTRQNSATNRPQSSTYPAPLFSNFNFGFDRPRQTTTSDDPNGGIRNQMLNAAIGATRVFSQFLGAAISGAAKQLQSFVRNSTKLVSEAATV